MNGFFSPEVETFQQMLYADAVRGWDATGAMGITKEGNVDIKKQAAAASIFVSSTEFDAFKKKMLSSYHAVIGHNRKATHGEKRHEDAHPFWDKDNKIVLVHNGMISNHKELCTNSTVDSAAVANAFADKESLEVLPSVQGAYAFIWYDVKQKKVFFCRNESRPLFLVETDDLFALMSEPSLAVWTLGRNNIKITSIKQIEDHTLFEYDLASHKIEVVQKYEQKKTVTTYNKYNGGTGTTSNNIIYLPSQHKQELVTPPFKKTLGVLYNTMEVIEVDPKCFLTNKDIPTRERAVDIYNNRQLIYIQISTYEEIVNKTTGVVSVTVKGQPININHQWLICKAHMSKHEFDLIDLTEVFEFQIASIIRGKDMNVLMYGKIGNILDAKETNNGCTVTESMWFDSVFPDKCDLCRLPLHYKDLPESTIEYENYQVKHALCPACTVKYESSKEK